MVHPGTLISRDTSAGREHERRARTIPAALQCLLALCPPPSLLRWRGRPLLPAAGSTAPHPANSAILHQVGLFIGFYHGQQLVLSETRTDKPYSSSRLSCRPKGLCADGMRRTASAARIPRPECSKSMLHRLSSQPKGRTEVGCAAMKRSRRLTASANVKYPKLWYSAACSICVILSFCVVLRPGAPNESNAEAKPAT